VFGSKRIGRALPSMLRVMNIMSRVFVVPKKMYVKVLQAKKRRPDDDPDKGRNIVAKAKHTYIFILGKELCQTVIILIHRI
jgi:hypothetical protein